MENVEVNVVSLGRVLEGHGKITSTLEDHEIDGFGEKLKTSVARVEQPGCIACGDGRPCLHQADGSPRQIRARIFGAGAAPLAMVGMADESFIETASSIKSQEDLYSVTARLHERLGNEESAHFDCGAAKGLLEHVRTVAELSPDDPNLAVALSVLEKELPEEDTRALAQGVISQTAELAALLQRIDWDGGKYVQHVADKAPANVEVLETKDDEVGGHAEVAVVLVDGPVDEGGHAIYTLDEEKLAQETGRQVFVANLEELRRTARQLGDYPRNLTALILHQICGVYPNLGDGSHPVYVLSVA